MNSDMHQSELGLEARSISELADAAGVEIRCRTGCVWITLDGDARDIILEAGQSFTTQEHRRALVYALQPSCLTLFDEAPLRMAATRQPSAAAVHRVSDRLAFS